MELEYVSVPEGVVGSGGTVEEGGLGPHEIKCGRKLLRGKKLCLHFPVSGLLNINKGSLCNYYLL